MPEPRHVLARRPDSPSLETGDTGRTTKLPLELVAEQAQRLTVFTTTALVLWSFALSLELVLLPTISADWQRNWKIIPIEATGVVISAIMRWYLGRRSTTLENKDVAGFAMMLSSAALVAAANAWAMPTLTERSQEIRPSWIALVIVIYAMIAPSTPRRMLLASIVAATFDPLFFGIAWLTGSRAPSIVQAVALCWASYACAFVAVVPAKVLHRIGRRLKEAQELGSYQLVERLGEGGMGEVWRAEHRLLARDAAIKLVRAEVLGVRDEAGREVVLKRFEREAQAIAALNSPHTIQIFDFGLTQEGTFYYVMELLAGRDLESLIREFGPLPADRTVFLLRQVCHSLADAHARGLVHRDIKPANIHICRMGLDYDFVKVLDFGLVKFRDRPQSNDTLTTLDQVTRGTPAYMAPETILGDGDVDRRADVYALGCVAYFVLTGSLVFEADTSMKMLMQHLHATPTRPSERSELPIPRELDDLIMACLEKDPKKRPQNAGELLAMVHNCGCAQSWGQDQAEQWWKTHLPHLTGALSAGARRQTPQSTVSV